MCVIVLYRNTSLYLRFLNFGIFFAYQLCKNLKASLSMTRILLNLKETLVNAWTLQNYGDFLLMVCKRSYVPLNEENCMQNVEKNQNFVLPFFFHLDGKKCLHKLKSSVL